MYLGAVCERTNSPRSCTSNRLGVIMLYFLLGLPVTPFKGKGFNKVLFILKIITAIKCNPEVLFPLRGYKLSMSMMCSRHTNVPFNYFLLLSNLFFCCSLIYINDKVCFFFPSYFLFYVFFYF